MSLISSLEIEEITTKNHPNTSSFIFRHLPTTMGVTIGNYLRRLLISYVSGLAPVGVVIADKNGPVKSKFTTLEGVVESTIYLILNLKKIVLEEKEPKEGIFYLELKIENKKTEERIVTAKDFLKSKEVEIKNPELYLATVSPGGVLEIRLYYRKDWGYHRAEEQKKYNWWKEHFDNEENVISLDTDYSPIKSGHEDDQVNFEVKTMVVSLTKEEEELKLTVATNGSIRPKNALLEVLQISQDLLSRIINSVKSNSGKREKKNLKESGGRDKEESVLDMADDSEK